MLLAFRGADTNKLLVANAIAPPNSLPFNSPCPCASLPNSQSPPLLDRIGANLDAELAPASFLVTCAGQARQASEVRCRDLGCGRVGQSCRSLGNAHHTNGWELMRALCDDARAIASARLRALSLSLPFDLLVVSLPLSLFGKI